MSRLSGRLRSGSVRLPCEALAEEDCSESEGSWMGDVEPGVSSAGPTDSGAAASLHYGLYSASSLANGLRNHDEQLQRRARRRRQMDHVEQMHMHEQHHTHLQMHAHQQTHSLEQNTQTEHSNTHLQSQTHIHMDAQMCMDADVLTHKHTHAEMDSHIDSNSPLMERDTSLVPEDLSITPKSETYTSIIHSTHPLQTSQPSQNYIALQHSPVSKCNVETVQTPTFCKPETDHLPSPDMCHSSSVGHNLMNTPIEAERKYTLRSSGRPRFPCHLRKSSRLRRAAEDSILKREGEQREEEEEENIWRREEIRLKEELFPEVTSAALPPRVVQAPTKSSSMVPNHSASTAFGSECSTVTQPSTRGKRRGRFLGVRKIVVKIARIPVHLSRRQKSYKISSLESVGLASRGEVGPGNEGSEGVFGGETGTPITREPTALLRMKNNGRSVMVMFPPGELPVILKRRRGRPPKQALPGQPDMRETRAGAANAAEPKKPRRRRRVKLPSPLPSYVNDTNDVKVEYADVLSKLAFLNRQPPSTGRCSPPRCWTPTEPETFHTSPENPNLSTLLHRLTGFRRRGGRAGCMGGRGGGMAGCSEAFKRSFSDFFETIGKKRKVPLSEPGTPRKRGKGVSGGISRSAFSEQGIPVPGEKVRKRRARKNGALKGGQGIQEQDWQNGRSGWGEKGDPDTPERAGSYQGSCSPRGGFPSSETGKGGLYHSPGRRGAGSGEDSHGMFAGYFRSLLDSDDSSDLLDISMASPTGRQDARKLTPGYEGSSPGAAHRWSPAFPKRSPKGSANTGEGPLLPSAQTQSQSSSVTRPPYSYNVSQTSPTTPFPKSPAVSLSRSPSSPHPSSGGFSQYPSAYSGTVPQGTGICPVPQQQRPSDCSFTYGTKASPAPSAQRQISYSNYHASAKRHYSGYPGPAHAMQQSESAGPGSPGGSYMSISKTSPFSSSSSPPEGCRQYQSSALWGYRQGGPTWGSDGFGTHQFHGYSDYGVGTASSESKDILDISNYTPQKAKQRPCPDTFSESSSDSSHTGIGSVGAPFCPRDVPVPEGQSSLSSLEKLMLDWNENSAGPSYNWSQNVLFQGGTKPGRGRRKRSEPQNEREACPMPPGSPASPPMQGGGPKRGSSAGRQPRGARGRGGFSPCQRERPLPPKPKPQKPAAPAGVGQMTSTGGLYQETLDYYSGDSSSLSPLSHAPEPCEYPSPYSAHTSTPSSDERFAQIYPSDSASLSPSLSTQSDVLKQYPKPGPPPQTYGHAARTFSPTLSPSPRLLPQCGSAMSPHRVSKDQFPQYDSPSYSGSPCWYGQGGSVANSPHSYEEQRSIAIAMPSHKRDMSLMGPGMRVPSHSPYPPPVLRGPTMSSSCVGGTLDSSPQHEELGYHSNMDSYAPLGHRYMSQTARGGVLCQLLDQPNDEGFTVTSL
ncbi:AT-hook DNA-binding motif-containing protein 1 [Electrophorus electricus]|uniref:AT-hook DNA-binding motif-containing protein 1 n=1 Tax=Electrophorus electricus TaxID=8005 RepID=UPI0015D0466D|nr:AT-hook DNA-binding motif-containing protein 1 [Electrophorus electricus]XP_026883276.2 AT-hook DNA-binding motif-containing protein 1 [Electrophorus electricus]